MQKPQGETPSWELVSASEQFKSAPREVKEAVRERFYEQHVAPSVPDGMGDAVWGRFVERTSADFDQDTLSMVSANDNPPAEQQQDGVEAMDYAKEVGGGALTGTGSLVKGLGDMVRHDPQDRLPISTPAGDFTPLSARIGKLTDPITSAIANAIDVPGDWLTKKGKAISDSKTDAAKKALESSTPSGDIDKPSTWSMGEDPSVTGYGLHLSNLAGQFLPQMGALLATKGRTSQTPAMMGVGGLQAGGAAGDEVEERIAETSDLDLQKSSGLYQQLRETMTEGEARKSLIETARNAAFEGAAPVGALGGLATQVALGPLQRSIGGSVGRRLAAGTMIEAPLEGIQEVTETVEARRATNKALTEDRSLTKDTFGDFALGALGGAGFSVAGTALSGKDNNTEAAADPVQEDADATFKNTPEQPRLEAPGLQGLPEPDQVFYGDSQGNMQDIGPVKSVDGVMQPTPQSQQWVNPANRTDAPVDLIGGEGMEAQTPRGTPPGLQGQFIPKQGQQPMTPPARMGLTLDGNIERLGLPEPEAFVVDSEGNTQRGATAPQVFNEPPMKGGAGMDQQAPTAPPKQRKAAPKAMPDEKSPQERAQYSWDSMNTFERNKAAQDTLGYADADMTEAAAKAWDQLAVQDQQKLADAMDQDSGQRWDAPNQKISDKDRPVLQNRDRSTDASITQMQDIKNNPDYDRLSVSRDFGNGAPVVEPGADFPATQLGRSERTTTSTGRKIPVQYAVVEADQLLPSNDALGNSIPEYANGVEGKSRAIAGNGRVAGITAAWKSSKPGKAEAYKKQMIEDTQHGIDPKVIRAMKQPVLVRIMPLEEVSNNIGDESNVSGQAGLSPTEQANTDMRRIDLAELSLTEDNELSENTVLDFIKGMPKSELGTLLTKSGRPTPAAYARAEAALFQQAYQNEALTENLVDLKGDAKFIMNALMRAAPAMAKLEGAGIYDIRPLVSEAAEVAVNARRQGIKLSEFIKMGDFGRNPQVMPILEMMIESGQRTTAIGDKLINLAQMAYTEANKAGQDMFGEVDKQSPEALMKKAFDGEKANAQEIDGTPEALGDDGRSRPDASNAEGRAADGEGKPDSGAVQADQPAKPETAEARLKKKAAEKKASTEPTTEKWRKNYLLAKKRATELDLDPKEHGKLPGLVKAIDAAIAEKAKPEAQTQLTAQQKQASGSVDAAKVHLDNSVDLTSALAAIARGAQLSTEPNGDVILSGSKIITFPKPPTSIDEVIAPLATALLEQMRADGVSMPSNPADMTRDQFAIAYHFANIIPEFEISGSDIGGVVQGSSRGLTVDSDKLYDKIIEQAKEQAKPALKLNQQTEETLAAEAERLEQLQKEEAAQKAKQKAAESKARERDADKARADEVVDDFQLGQPAEDAMSGMDDIFADDSDARYSIKKKPAQTETKAFKDWFENSEVTGSDGRPEVMYRGIDADATVMKPNDKGLIWLTPSAKYASDPHYGGREGGAVYPLYVKAENLFDHNNLEHKNLLIQRKSPLFRAAANGDFRALGDESVVSVLKDLGFDGFRAIEPEGQSSLAVFESTQVKSAIGNDGSFGAANPDIRYSKSKKDAAPKNLYVAHNLSIDNLLYADQLGGLAAPSLAVGNIDTGAFDSFGEITLLADPSMLESSKARTFDADVYTPRHPKAVYDINRKAYDAMADSIKELPGDLRFPDISSLDDSGPNAILYSDAAKLLYLTEQGKAPAAKQKKVGAWLKKAAKLGVNRNELAHDARFQKIALDEMKRVTEELYKADPVIAKRRERFFTEVDENGKEFVPFSRLNSMVNEVVRYQDGGGIDSDQLKTDISKKFRTKKSEEDFKQWVTDKFNSMTDKKRIFKGFTPAGGRKYVDYNLDNIVKEMTRQVQGGEGFNYGVGSIRAMYASEMKSVDSVKARRDKIISADEFNKIKEETNKKFDDVMASLAPYYKYDADSFSYVSDASQSIAEGPSGWREAFDLDADSRKIITDFVDYLKNLPTEYFETKVGRAVDLGEFSYAVVPKGTPSNITKILRDKGVKVKTYDAGTEGAREAAIRSTNDILFLQKEKDATQKQSATAQKVKTPKVKAQDITDALASTPELAGVKVVQSFDELPARARKQAEIDGVNPGDIDGIYVNGTSYVVADNHATVAEAVRTAVHEEVGHLGIRGLLGDKLTPTMERIYSSMATTAAGRKLIKDIRADYSHLRDKDQRQAVAEELVAHLIETGDKPNLVQRFVSKVRELLRAMFPRVKWTNLDVLALAEQSRAWLKQGAKGKDTGTLYSIKGKKNKHTSESFSDLTDKQKAALNKIAPLTTRQKASEWLRQKSDRSALKARQGIIDRFAALKEIDEKAHGKDILNTDITNSSWVLARMSSAASGALHAMLNNGRIYLDQKQKVIDIQDGDALGLGATLARLGSPAEIERFMGWIAGNRSARLAAEGRENLFSADDIGALKTLNEGKTESGKARKALYDDVFKEFQQYRDDVLAIAEQTGIITAENRAMWRDEFYVPFYRVMDEEAKVGGPGGTKGLTRQEAYKKLKGGKQNLNDLLQNTMLNFNHLLTASLKNQAAAQALSNAEQIGVAEKTTEAARDKKASTFVLVDGKQQWYNIDDPLVFEALSMISDGGLNTAAVKVMSAFKRVFTNMTTITPQFIIANLLRDSMQATATSPVSMNFVKNIVAGGKDWTDGKKRARMMATGGAFSFGHIYNNDPHEMKAHLTRNLKSAQLLSSTKLIPEALKAGWDAWNAVANAAENANRAAIFSQNEKSKGKLAAAFEARDLMDFSAHGAWPAVRFLIRVIPFLNARLQGNDKLYRAGFKPSVLTAFNKGDASDKQATKRFLSVVGAISAASMALMLVNNDDEEYRKLEEWQKDTYWFVRVGDKAFFIPKPFEVGVIATMAERLLQQGIDDKATGDLFKQRLGHALTETFAFSVVPHAFQPILDVYSNVDAFTDRPIESMGMERLSKGLRSRANTTAPARALSSVTRVFGDDFPLAVSPVQADHLIAGYLGQVGAWGAGLVDTMWRTANGETQPARHWHEYQPIRRFYKDLDTPNAYTRYSTLFYEGLRESGKVYADVMELQKLGKEDQMRETINKNRDMLGMRKNLNRAQRDLSKINARIGMIRIGGLDAEEKRREIDRLTVIKSRITEAAGKQVEAMKAAR